MRRKGSISKFCSKCYRERDLPYHYYCKQCAKTYQSQWRRTHALNPFQKAKAKTRSKTFYLIRKGVLKRQECEICHCSRVQAHHEDYSDPLNIKWFCSICHRKYHIELSYNEWKWKQLSLF